MVEFLSGGAADDIGDAFLALTMLALALLAAAFGVTTALRPARRKRPAGPNQS